MRTTPTGLAALTLLFALATTASAQGPAPGSTRHRSPDAEYTFEDEEIFTQPTGPAGPRIHIPSRGSRRTLVRPRVHFLPEIRRSIETL